MIQLIAALLVILISFGFLCLIATAAKKPYDSVDLLGAGLFVILILVGLGRLAWLSFS